VANAPLTALSTAEPDAPSEGSADGIETQNQLGRFRQSCGQLQAARYPTQMRV